MLNHMEEEKVELLCNHCGQVFTVFLREIAEHNEKVTCPGCGESFQAEVGKGRVASTDISKRQS
jgi:predicted Zn finger-like uncharacterized protein